MRNKSLILSFVMLALACAVSPRAGAQGAAKTGPATVRDADAEKDSLRNLQVARHYFKLKKAYVAALNRVEEIMAGNPAFSRLDEVLYIAGASSLRLAENRGKQTAKLTPEQLRDDAREYLTRLVKEYPQSQFRAEAEKELRALGPKKVTQ